MRLRGHRCFDLLHRRGKRHDSDHLVLRVVQADPRRLSPPLQRWENLDPGARRCRCGVVISSKVSKRSVKRNRLRRALHQHLRSRLEGDPGLADRWLLLSLRPSAADAGPGLLEECDRLLKKAGLLP